MKRATITIPDELQQALETYQRDQQAAITLAMIMRAALHDYLAQRGYVAATQPLRISPAPQGSGHDDVSLAHDRYLADL
jgi:hypothetical protein